MYRLSLESLKAKRIEYQNMTSKQLEQECRAKHVFSKADNKKDCVNKLMRVADSAVYKKSRPLREMYYADGESEDIDELWEEYKKRWDGLS